jgi:hypothetical protein
MTALPKPSDAPRLRASSHARRPLPRPETPSPIQSVYAAPAPARRFEDLRRIAPDLGLTGLHPKAVASLIGLYGLLMLGFWVSFGTGATSLTLGVITILATMYFGLLGGGIMLADSVSPGAPGRGFNEFLGGETLIGTGWISGKEAYAQIVVLPLALAGGGAMFGLIWRLTAG